ncbi:unnamed protein product [Aspergillus oryzae]|uniref:Unnamed protein product n=2 Tax=Aspergillus oryzae TaxID=5062 RepID=A0AAN4YQN5_ASPOZ|nr:unnamed protein product [Aspergillus oryzae]GMF86850.1 unnamed protein product [Aspergillus oryzae]GMG06011.1 unnamed protein product [Aspergillus oryzae]GMG31297.1 unnamed protein product [Aspergillus oryzae]GMG44937.1 unnamed protein product [Aspergillus oryzae var. brunneus]
MAGSHRALGTEPTRSRSSTSSTLNSESHVSNTEPRRPGTARSTGRSSSRTIPDNQSVLHSSNTTEHGAAVPEDVKSQNEKNGIELGLESVTDPNERGVDLEKGAQPTSSLEKSNSPQRDSKLVSLYELILSL